MIEAIVKHLAPEMLAKMMIGMNSAVRLLLTVGDNRGRLRSKASFAALCGASPVPTSTGKTLRHRLSRGGDRAANSAIHIIAIGRLRLDPRTKDYLGMRIVLGGSKRKAIRYLKRYMARERCSALSRSGKTRFIARETLLDSQKGVQGTQLDNEESKRFCKTHNLEPSMNGRENCWDNAVAENVFCSLKKERIRKRVYKKQEMARENTFYHIEVFYNRSRRHIPLGGPSPEAFESQAARTQALSRITGAFISGSQTREIAPPQRVLIRRR